MTHEYSKIKAIIWSLSWALCFTLAMSFAKLLSPEVGTLMLIFMRFVFGLIFVIPMILTTGITQAFKTKRLSLHLIRILFTATSVACTYYAYRNLDLAFATSIGYTAPLFMTSLAIIFLGEVVSWQKWSLIILGYIGVLIMVDPTDFQMNIAFIVALCSNFFAGCAIVTVKKLSSTETNTTLLAYSSIASAALAGILVIFSWRTPSLRDSLILMAMGMFGTLSQYSKINSLRYADASFAAPFEYTRLVMAIPIGYLLFSEIPTIWMLIGSLVIIISTFVLAQIERQQQASNAP